MMVMVLMTSKATTVIWFMKVRFPKGRKKGDKGRKGRKEGRKGGRKGKAPWDRYDEDIIYVLDKV